MNKRFAIFASLLVAMSLTGAGCISIGSAGPTNNNADGGVFKSTDRGEIWNQKGAILTADGQKKTMNGLSITTLAQDPEDPMALYAGTSDSGLYYSYDGGDSWTQAPGLNKGMVAGIAIHPKDKCVVYVTNGNRLMKTTDCSRTWNSVFVDARPQRATSAVAIDWFRPNIVWLGEDSGDLLKSTNDGTSWEKVDNFATEIVKIAFSPVDSREMYIGSLKDGVWRSKDGGTTPTGWVDMSLAYKNFEGTKDYRDFAISIADPKVLVLASSYGLIRSKDDGDKWEALNLLTPPGNSAIYSLALDPRDVNTIYYGTATTFHRSSDGGINWVPKKLPTARAATQLLVDSAKSDVIYMGVTKFSKQ